MMAVILANRSARSGSPAAGVFVPASLRGVFLHSGLDVVVFLAAANPSRAAGSIGGLHREEAISVLAASFR
jgi:hypothetical protein